MLEPINQESRLLKADVFDKKPFQPLKDLVDSKWQMSYLVINEEVINTNKSASIFKFPKTPLTRYIPPRYGKILRLITEDHIPASTSNAYLKAYSLEGKFGIVANKRYIMVPAIQTLSKDLADLNPQKQKAVRAALNFDKIYIELVYDLIQAQKIVKDDKLLETLSNNFIKLNQTIKNAKPSVTDLEKLSTPCVQPLWQRVGEDSPSQQELSQNYFNYVNEKLDNVTTQFAVIQNKKSLFHKSKAIKLAESLREEKKNIVNDKSYHNDIIELERY